MKMWQDKMKRGFTLLELLVVMAIMVIMMGVAVSMNFGITRGMGMRSAVDHMRSVLLHARQSAILNGRPVYVVIEVKATNSNYTVSRQEGIVSDKGPGTPSNVFGDRFADLSMLEPGIKVFNLSNVNNVNTRQTEVTNVVDYGGWYGVETADAIWLEGDEYGWVVFPTTALPRGYEFGNGGVYSPPNVKFNADGTAEAKYEIDIIETKKSNMGDPFARLTVYQYTGFIEVNYL